MPKLSSVFAVAAAAAAVVLAVKLTTEAPLSRRPKFRSFPAPSDKMMAINDLPEELLQNVHSLLPPKDLKSAVLVDKWWNKVGEDPSLWRQCEVTVRNREDIAKLTTRRLHLVQKIHIEPGANWGNAEWELFFQSVEKLPELKKIDGLRLQNLESVDPELLAKALTGLEHAHLEGIKLSNVQITSILQHALQDTSKLKALCLDHHDLSSIEAEVLARIVSKLDEVRLTYTKLSTSQITSILTHMVEDNTEIKTLYLEGNDRSEVDKEVLANAMIRLEEISICHTELNTPQIISILTKIVEQDSRLKNLGLRWNSLSDVEDELLARAVNKMEVVNLHGAELSTSKITSILIHVVQQDSKLKDLGLSGNNLMAVDGDVLGRAVLKLERFCYGMADYPSFTAEQMATMAKHIVEDNTKLKRYFYGFYDLTAVEEEVLLRAVNGLDKFDMSQAQMSPLQISSILTSIVEQDSALKKLSLRYRDLSAMEKEFLAKAVNKLEEVDLCSTELSTPQITSILTNVMEQDSKLKKLTLSRNNLSTVEEELLARDVNRLEEVNLDDAKISTLQISNILTQVMEHDSQLKKLSLRENDLSAVEKELLARAVNRMVEVNLDDAKLTTLQITNILTQVMEHDSQLKKLSLRENDLSAVEKELLARAVNKLEEVDVDDAELSTLQITSILTNFLERDSKLKKLNLFRNNLSAVERELLDRAIKKLY